MPITRRQFLRLGTASMFGILSSGLLRFGMPSAAAQGISDYRAAVCIFLVGGNDGNNMFIPNDDTGYQAYATARNGLAISRNQLLPVQTRSGNLPYAFHPQLPELHDLFSQNKLAVLANVGTLRAPISRAEILAGSTARPHSLFSHADQQNQWQSFRVDDYGQADAGWGGLIADSLQALSPAASFPSMVSVAGSNLYCEGIQTRPAVIDPNNINGLYGFDSSSASQIHLQAMQQLLDLDNDASLISAASATTRNMFSQIQVQSAALANLPNLATAFPATGIGQQFLRVAQMIQARAALGLNRQLFFIGLDGFDTHSNQLAIQATLFGQLSAAMASFYQATVEMGVASQVTSFTQSDFGRTLMPANDGSDHAWGNHHLIMGGAVNGGDVYGKFPSLILGGEDDWSDEGRWIPTTSVDQYGATIATWLGVNSGDLPAIFPNLGNFSAQNLGFLT